MEFQFLSFPSLFTYLLFAFTLLKLVKRYKPNSLVMSSQNLPPGPWKLPLIGNMHQLVTALPHHCLRDMALKYGPIMHLQLGEVSTVIVSSPEVAREVMKTHDINFAERPPVLPARIVFYDCTDIAFAPYGVYWRQLRKICTSELLSAKRVQSFQSVRVEEVSNLISRIKLQAGMPINLSAKILQLIYGITSRVAFKRCRNQEAFIAVVARLSEIFGGFSISDMFPSVRFLPLVSGMRSKLEKVHKEADRILENIVNEHKETTTAGNGEEGDDLVDVLLRLQDHGDLEFPLTGKNIKAVVLDIFSGGSETSATVVEWAMSEMVKNPRVMKKAQAEVRQVFDGKGNADETEIHKLKFLKSVIKETLRLHPPFPLLLPRESGEGCEISGCEISGYEIPARTRVMVNAWAIGRDPKCWTEAERFYPERFFDSSIDYKGTDFEYIPFGAGRRICPGIIFGWANAELPLAQLLYHFNWELPNGVTQEELDMTEKFGASVRRMNDLYLVPVPYHPVAVE